MPMTMKQILRRTTRDRIEKAQTTVKVTKLKLGVSKRTKKAMAIARVFSLDRVKKGIKRNKYVTSITFLPKKNVKVSCSCSDFMYRWEWSLNRKGAADIIYGNGDPPDDKNPTMIPGTCKHVVAFWEYLEDKDLVLPAYQYADRPVGKKKK